MKVLQLCHKMPNPPSDGGAQAIHNTTLGLLEKGIDVKVLAVNPTRNFVDVTLLPKDYVEATRFEAVEVDTRIKPAQVALNFFKDQSYFVARFQSKAFAEKLIEVLTETNYDVVQLEHLYLYLYVDLIREHSTAKIIFRPQNVEYIIWERYLENIKNPLKRLFIKTATRRLKKFEKSNTGKVDGIICLTPDDQAIIESFSPNVPICSIPMGFNFDALENFNIDDQFKDFPIFYHLGSMDWMPNEEAIQWFLDDIAELAIEKIPDVRIHLAGRNMQDYFFKQKTKNLIIEGEVKDPLLYQKDKTIMIVPLLSGSGIRAKIVEGIALGKVIITTTIGAQGINYVNGKNLLIADTPSEFAHQMQRCSQSIELCKMIGANALELSKTDYHYLGTASKLIDFYSKILQENEI